MNAGQKLSTTELHVARKIPLKLQCARRTKCNVKAIKCSYHTRQCQSVLRTTTQVNGKAENSTPVIPETPKPTVTKICAGDYIGDF